MNCGVTIGALQCKFISTAVQFLTYWERVFPAKKLKQAWLFARLIVTLPSVKLLTLEKIQASLVICSLNRNFATNINILHTMKKILLLLPGLLLLACTHQKTETTQPEVDTIEEVKPLERSDFHFTYDFEKNEDGEYAYIVVNAWKSEDELAFTCRNDLVEAREEKPDGEGWISEDDINFDGIPDLMIYLGLLAYGQVASFYDAYVWNPETREFDHVDIFNSIGEPLIDAENHCITSTGRSGPDHFYTQKYEWKDGELVLTEEKTEKIEWGDEDD